MIGSTSVKLPLRSSAILNIENVDNYGFFWSILARLHHIADSKNGHLNRIPNFRQFLKELKYEGFGFTNGFNCSDIHRFQRIKNLNINIFELKFHQDHNK